MAGTNDHEEETALEEGETKRNPKKKHKHKKKRRLDVKMEIVPENPQKVAPLVGYFPSGFDPQSTQDGIGVRVFRNKAKQNRMQLVVSPNGSKVDFVGSNHTGEAAAAQVCTYALGVLDKETKTLKIVPIASNKIFRLEPRVSGVDHPDEVIQELKEDATAAQDAALERTNRLNNLTLLYGTKKSRSQAKKLASLKQKEEPGAQEGLESKFKDVAINKEAMETEVSTGRNIPPHDTTATIPEKAYPLGKIIFEGELKYVLEVLELVESGAEIEASVYPSFVCNRAHKLLEIQDELQKKKLACILSYITHLVKFKEKQSIDRSDSAKNYTIPDILYKKFVGMFTDSSSQKSMTTDFGRHRLPVEKSNLLVSYVLVLTLFADGFRTDPSDIARDLKMGIMSIRDHYKNLGCKIELVDKVSFVTLPVPLQFPRPRLKKRQR